jgi:predicted site-specific integrase-resolvase
LSSAKERNNAEAKEEAAYRQALYDGGNSGDAHRWPFSPFLGPLEEVPEFRHVALVNRSVRNEMRRIGYARVSAPHQNLDRQIAALREQRCDQIFREKASGKDVKNRPQLEKAIDALGTGDVLVLAEWDRATRSMLDGVNIIERIHARGALLKVLDKPYLDLTTAIGRGFIAFLSAMAEDERQRHRQASERRQEGCPSQGRQVRPQVEAQRTSAQGGHPAVAQGGERAGGRPHLQRAPRHRAAPAPWRVEAHRPTPQWLRISARRRQIGFEGVKDRRRPLSAVLAQKSAVLSASLRRPPRAPRTTVERRSWSSPERVKSMTSSSPI